MTHDELLSAIDTQIVTAPPFASGGYTRFLNALRAVVELHKPDLDGLICKECTASESEWYPCPTIQDIKKELK